MTSETKTGVAVRSYAHGDTPNESEISICLPLTFLQPR